MERRGGGDQRSWSAVGFALELGYLIAVPITLFALGGRFLDRRLGTSPWFLLAGIVVAMGISGVAIARRIRTLL